MIRFACSTALCALCLIATAKPDAAFTIHRTVNKGEKFQYKLHAEIHAAGQMAVYDGIDEEDVVSLSPDGSYAIAIKQVSGTVKIGTKSMPAGGPGTQTYFYRADGTLIQISEAGSGPQTDYLAANLQSIPEPGKPVKVGDIWTHDFKIDANDTVAIHGEYKVLGEDTVNGVKTLKILQTTKEVGVPNPASVTATVWLSESDWNVQEFTATWTNFPMGASPAPIGATVTENLIKASS